MKRKIMLIMILVLVLSLSVACSGNTKPAPAPEPTPMPAPAEPEQMPEAEPMETALEYMDISPADAVALIEDMPEIIIIDVSPLYAKGHIPNSINYPVGDGTLDNAILDLDPEATYLVYCHSDSASMLGAQKLVDAGFTKVYRLEGNYSAWVDEGYPVEK